MTEAIDLEQLREELESKRRELLDNVVRARAMGAAETDVAAPDIADRATSAFQREFSFFLSENENSMLRLIDEALARIKEGRFGRCVHCGDAIEAPRLKAIPWARHCIACQELQDRGDL